MLVLGRSLFCHILLPKHWEESIWRCQLPFLLKKTERRGACFQSHVPLLPLGSPLLTTHTVACASVPGVPHLTIHTVVCSSPWNLCMPVLGSLNCHLSLETQPAHSAGPVRSTLTNSKAAWPSVSDIHLLKIFTQFAGFTLPPHICLGLLLCLHALEEPAFFSRPEGKRFVFIEHLPCGPSSLVSSATQPELQEEDAKVHRKDEKAGPQRR